MKKWIPSAWLRRYYAYRRRLANRPYKGKGVECPVCQSEFKMFAPYGVANTPNRRCPECDSLERHRLMWKFLQEKTSLLHDDIKKRLLHFAPERCFFSLFRDHSAIDYFPCDLEPELYDYDGRGQVTRVDITHIPFEDGYFDAILCNHVLEHIPDDRQAMRELYRVLKKGGWGIFQIPIDLEREKTYEDFSLTSPEDRLRAFGQRDHVRWYGRDYSDRLASVGFKVHEDDYVKGFSPQQMAKWRLDPSEIIYFVTK